MIKVEWSAGARRDLRRLFAFLQPKDPAAAVAAITSIDRATDRLVRFPFSAPTTGMKDFRKLSADGNYVVIYRVRSGKILIARVHHASENWAES